MATKTDSSINEQLQQTDGDELVRELFSPADLRLTPEEYAARHAHEWACFSFHLYRYQDDELGTWVRRLGEVLFDQRELEDCRRRFLTPQELAAVKQREAEAF